MEVIVPIAQFKAQCYQMLEDAQKHNKKLIITKRGKRVAEIIPSPSAEQEPSIIGLLQGRAEIVGDIVAPLNVEWDAEK